MRAVTAATLAVLLAICLGAVGYLAFGVFDTQATGPGTRVTLLLNRSGGLLTTSQVTMRGIKVGKVTAIRATTSELRVSIELDAAQPVPSNCQISIENLSAAGEQYIEFRPQRIEPPYLVDGATIPAAQVRPTYTVAELLSKGNALISALDPHDLETIVRNLGAGLTNNTAALDHLAVTAGLFARMVNDDQPAMRQLFNNLAAMTSGLGDVDAGQALAQTGAALPSTLEKFNKLLMQLQRLNNDGKDVFADNGEVVSGIDRLIEYVDTVSGPMTTFMTALEPTIQPLRNVKLDAGHWLDFWDSTFADEGGMRVHLAVPEWPQP
ncbi:MlaD family protein [Mycobacteroides saopaulense]|uniref:Mce/MlaD domain-containing protein n=1 Tax=Mycobacteroides saopaulense TaxID=1578165 RepID=A0ABX3BZ58_9MYCO|nr:MlaD family protein [Mycobacteroides saopaulense]OHT81487.1 hypothetical protein BKG68_21275 [Mycobacteroides saopaulense]OHU09015.1 hypothetical protein BKG73_13235 [Mycobacteroides saopaulense]